MKIMTIRTLDELAQALSRIAKGMGRTRNDLVTQILWDWAKSQGAL